jgi:prevent-host-death family protein
MQMETIDVSEAQDHLKELLSKARENGRQIILSDNEKPIARLIPLYGRIPGLHAGAIWTSNDFNEPLSNEYWVEGQ